MDKGEIFSVVLFPSGAIAVGTTGVKNAPSCVSIGLTAGVLGASNVKNEEVVDSDKRRDSVRVKACFVVGEPVSDFSVGVKATVLSFIVVNGNKVAVTLDVVNRGLLLEVNSVAFLVVVSKVVFIPTSANTVCGISFLLVKGTFVDNTETTDAAEGATTGFEIFWKGMAVAILIADSVVLRTLMGCILVLITSGGK